MLSATERYVISYNGEVYNCRALREELEHAGAVKRPWRGTSDTEVMLAAIETWGLIPALRRFIGMFAFGLWDREERKLHLVRDRVGIKPLYYAYGEGALIFGSELRALTAHPSHAGRIDRAALAGFLQYCYVPAPRSIYERTFKVAPGTVLTFDAPTEVASKETPFWSARETARAALADAFGGTEEEAIEAVDSLLRDAVKLRDRKSVV